MWILFFVVGGSVLMWFLSVLFGNVKDKLIINDEIVELKHLSPVEIDYIAKQLDRQVRDCLAKQRVRPGTFVGVTFVLHLSDEVICNIKPSVTVP